MKRFLVAVAAVLILNAMASADDKKPEGPVTLKLVAKKAKYKFEGGGKTPAEYKQELETLAAKAKKGERVRPPKPPTVDLVLQMVNTSKENVTIYVGGDSNVYEFELTGGAGAVTMNSGLAFTAEFRLPKAVTLAPGKSYDIPVKQLSDGNRGASRYVYWTGPGDYKLSATYTFSFEMNGKGTKVESDPVKITVEK